MVSLEVFNGSSFGQLANFLLQPMYLHGLPGSTRKKNAACNVSAAFLSIVCISVNVTWVGVLWEECDEEKHYKREVETWVVFQNKEGWLLWMSYLPAISSCVLKNHQQSSCDNSSWMSRIIMLFECFLKRLKGKQGFANLLPSLTSPAIPLHVYVKWFPPCFFSISFSLSLLLSLSFTHTNIHTT